MKKFAFLLALLPLAVSAGVVDTVAIESSRYVATPYTFNIAIPADYQTNADTRYPVLYLLHGHGGNQNSWGGIVPLDVIADDYGMIIVTPDGRNSWYWDSPLKPQLHMESFIIEELIPYVDANYRTIPERSQRAITGLSMGGHGAFWLACRHHALFGNVGATSGGVDIVPFPGKWSMDGLIGKKADNLDAWVSHSVMSRTDSIVPGRFNIIFDCGTEDFFYDVNCKLDSVLTSEGVEHIFLKSSGAHNGAYWSRSIYPQLDFFHRKFKETKK